MKFEEFKLDISILKALKELKYENVSPIQKKTIAVVVIAPTDDIADVDIVAAHKTAISFFNVFIFVNLFFPFFLLIVWFTSLPYIITYIFNLLLNIILTYY